MRCLKLKLSEPLINKITTSILNVMIKIVEALKSVKKN